MKQRSIQKQLPHLVLATVIIMGVFAAAVVFGWSRSARRYSVIVAQSSAFTQLSNGINQAYVDLDCYIQNPDDASLEKYNISMQSAAEAAAEIKRDAQVQDIYYAIVGIENMLSEANRINLEIIDRLDLNSFNDIYSLLSESQTLLTYMNLRVAAVNTLQNEWMQQQLTSTTEWIQRLVFLLIPLLILILCTLLFFSLRIARRIILPIQQISAQANRLAAGDLSVEDIPDQSLLEFSMIAQSLNKMKSELSVMIEKIREQSNIAARLHETELENLRISNDLKNTELRIMQAQINPHFLYNTLNSIGRLAYSAGDHQVVQLIEALSDMLRYNLNHIERSITLREELENLKNYMYIQKTRFGDKLTFQIQTNSCRMNLRMPCLTLQPIVENAIVHGLSPYNYEGNIEVDVMDEDQWTLVRIHDDGVGMEPSDIEKMVSGAFEASCQSVKHTSIGFCNVKTRLNSFFDKQDCVTVRSELGEGTTVVLKLYCEKGGQNV